MPTFNQLVRKGRQEVAYKSTAPALQKSLNSLKKKMTDEDVADLIQQLHGRIKSFMANIASMYYKVYNDKDHYFTYDSDNADEENYRIADNNSLKAERYVENTMNIINNSM